MHEADWSPLSPVGQPEGLTPSLRRPIPILPPWTVQEVYCSRAPIEGGRPAPSSSATTVLGKKSKQDPATKEAKFSGHDKATRDATHTLLLNLEPQHKNLLLQVRAYQSNR